MSLYRKARVLIYYSSCIELGILSLLLLVESVSLVSFLPFDFLENVVIFLFYTDLGGEFALGLWRRRWMGIH